MCWQVPHPQKYLDLQIDPVVREDVARKHLSHESNVGRLVYKHPLPQRLQTLLGDISALLHHQRLQATAVLADHPV
jgi:hypothetical protein